MPVTAIIGAAIGAVEAGVKKAFAKKADIEQQIANFQAEKEAKQNNSQTLTNGSGYHITTFNGVPVYVWLLLGVLILLNLKKR